MSVAAAPLLKMTSQTIILDSLSRLSRLPSREIAEIADEKRYSISSALAVEANRKPITRSPMELGEVNDTQALLQSRGMCWHWGDLARSDSEQPKSLRTLI